MNSDIKNQERRNSIKNLHKQIVQKLFITNPENDNTNALMEAIKNQNVKKSIEIIEHKNDIEELNLKNKNGNTPLLMAIKFKAKKSYKICYKLIESGCDLNLKNHQEHDALILAVKTKQYRIIKKLIECNCNMNANIHSGNSALSIAIMIQELGIAYKLIEHGSNGDYLFSHQKAKLLKYCIKNHKENIPNCLLNEEDYVSDENILNDNFLLMAMETNNENAALQLIDHGVSINSKDKEGGSPLFYAIETKKFRIATRLIKCDDTDLNIKNSFGNNALMICLSAKSNLQNMLTECHEIDENRFVMEAILGLIENMTVENLNMQNKNGFTALILASMALQAKIVNALIQNGCELNTKNNYRENALHIVCKNDDIISKTIMYQLIANGCELIQHKKCEEMFKVHKTNAQIICKTLILCSKKIDEKMEFLMKNEIIPFLFRSDVITDAPRKGRRKFIFKLRSFCFSCRK